MDGQSRGRQSAVGQDEDHTTAWMKGEQHNDNDSENILWGGDRYATKNARSASETQQRTNDEEEADSGALHSIGMFGIARGPG